MAKKQIIETELDFNTNNNWLNSDITFESHSAGESGLFSQKAVRQEFIRKKRKEI